MHHRNISPAERHPNHSWEVADNTARDALPLTADDVGKAVRVGAAAPYSFFILADHTGPAWSTLGSVSDHGALTGLGDDDHTQYLRADGTRQLTGNLAVAAAVTIDGRDVSVDGAKLDLIEAGATADQVASEVPFTPNGDIAAVNVQNAIVEVRDDTDTKLSAKAAIGGQLGGTPTSPDVRGIRETSGPTLLTLGAVGDGEYLRRVGTAVVGGAVVLDHGGLTGLADDDHPQYLLANGARTLTGNLAVAAAVTIDGRDVSADGSALDTHIGAANPHSGSVPTSRAISTTAPLAGGGSLAGDLTLSIPAATSAAPGHATAAQILKLDGIETGATADQNASEVPFTPNGDIAATNVQNAIVEVRDDTDTKLSTKADSSALTTHTGLTSGAHGISVYGASLIDDIDAATARGTLGLGTAATQASTAFEPSGAVAAHAALTTTHGVTGALVGTTDTQTLSGKTIAAGSNTITGIANGNIDAAAAIALSKLATVTASRALVSDAGGLITASAATATELGHLSGVTSGIQAQLNAKIGTTLTSANLLVGNASNVAAAVPVTGDISITNAGVTAIASGVIVNADVNAAAAIALSKLATVTASRLLVSDASGFVSPSAVTSTEAGYLSGVTSGIQAQLGDRVVGPASATDNAVVRFDATTGKLVQNSTAILEDSGNLRLGGAPDSARLTIRGVGTTAATTGLLVENSAGVANLTVRGDGVSIFHTTIAATSGSAGWSYSASGVLRSTITGSGSQTWYISTVTDEVGRIAYSTPAGAPGILFFDAAGLMRSQMRLLGGTGGLAFGGHALSTNPSDRFFIKDEGISVGVNSIAARAVIRGAGATSATTGLLVENSAGTANFTVRDDGGYAFRGGTVGVAQTGYTAFTNLVTLRTGDADTLTTAQLADILGTLIEDLKTKGLIAA